MGAKSR